MFSLEEILELRLCIIIRESQCQNLKNEILWKLNHGFAENPDEAEELESENRRLRKEIKMLEEIKNKVNSQF